VARRPTISAPHPRLVATFALVPITVGVEIGLYYAFAAWVSGANQFVLYACILALPLAPVLIFYAGGLLIWWPTVRWTTRKRWGVFLTSAALAALLVPAARLALAENGLGMLATLLVGLLGGGVALIVVGRICWTPPSESTEIHCAKCGYDLRGQRECRCPECGEQFTLGDVVGRLGPSRVPGTADVDSRP
jgi:hypothetical protein